MTSTDDDLFVASFKQDLSLSWVKDFEVESGSLFSSGGAALDGEGNVVVAGSASGASTVDFGGGNVTASGALDSFVAVLDDAGNHRLSRNLNTAAGSTAVVQGVAVMPTTQDIVVAGFFSGSIDLDGPSGTAPVSSSGGGDDVFVARLQASDLGLLWLKTAGDAEIQRPTGLAVDRQGDVVLTGSFRGTLNFTGGGNGVQNSAQSDAIFVVKLDGDLGEEMWSKASPPALSLLQRGEAIAVDGADQILVAGVVSGDLGPDFCSPSGTPDAEEAFIAKLAPDGTCLWAVRPLHAGAQAALAVTADPLGNVLVTGRFITTIDFGGGPASSTTVDAFLAKLLP